MTTLAGLDASTTDAAPVTRSLTLIEAVRDALREEMRRDDRVIVLGEDVGPLGGVFRATDGLLEEFGPQRIVDTPMMELGIAGLAVGMAMRGLRPVAEIQFADFMHAAADHIISDAARMRFRTNGNATCPLVVRTAYGGGLRGGPYHSQSVEAYYSHVPGLRVVAASTPADAKGLLTAAIRHPDPVLFLEHKRTYRAVRGEVPEGEYVVPLDRAHIVRDGDSITVVAWGWVLHETLAAAETLAAEGISVEVIDPRTLNPLDVDTIIESVRRTGRLSVVHEDTRAMGLGAEIAALVAEHALDALRAPVERIAMADVAGIPASGPMEDFLIPDRARIGAALRRVVATDRPERRLYSVPDSAPASNVVGTPASSVSLPSGAAEPLPSVEPVPIPAAAPREAWAGLIPQASSVVEVDLSEVADRMRATRDVWHQRGLEPSYTAYFAEALLAAVREVPHANATFDSDGPSIQRHAAVHLGLSVLDVSGQTARHAVLRDADTRNLVGLGVEIAQLRESGSSDLSSLRGATLTLVDYGPESALFATPDVLPGTVLAVRFGAVDERLITHERGFAIAPTTFVTASIDHRALDGMDAGAILGALKRWLEGRPRDD